MRLWLRGPLAQNLCHEYIPGMVSSEKPSTKPDRPGIAADLQDVAHGVHEEFDEWLDPRTIDECLAKVSAQFTDARVRSFVPLLVRRYVRDELQSRLVRLKQVS
jgi:hypothetical protein